MSTILTEELVGQSLKFVGEKAGGAVVEHVCSMLMDTILGGGSGSDAEADAEILAKLDEVLAGLGKVQDSLKQMEQAIAQVDADIDAAFIQQNSSSITSLYFEYVDCLTKLTMAAKGSDPSSKQDFATYRASLVDLSNQVKTEVPMNLQAIHDFVAGEDTSNWLEKQAKVNILKPKDIIDFYSKTKVPLIKIVMVEMKGIQLLRFAAANKDPGVNFSTTLQSVIGLKDYNLVSTILTEFPKPVPACISLYETKGLTYGTRQVTSKWYGGQATQLWQIEPAGSDRIITDGSDSNGFRLRNINSNNYLTFETNKVMGVDMYMLVATDSHNDAATWTFQLTPEFKFYLQSKDRPDTCLMADTENGDDPTRRYVWMGHSSDPGQDTNSFIINIYQGPFNNIWPGNIPNMRDGDRLIPGAYLESYNKKHRLTFEGEKFGVWDVDNKSWEWDSGVSIDTSSDPYVVFRGPGELQLYQGSNQIKIWGSVYFPMGMDYMVGVSDGGILQIANGKSGNVEWSSG